MAILNAHFVIFLQRIMKLNNAFILFRKLSLDMDKMSSMFQWSEIYKLN